MERSSQMKSMLKNHSLKYQSIHLFSGFQNKPEIVQKIRKMPLSTKNVKDRIIKMVANITSQQLREMNSAYFHLGVK